MTQEVTNVSEAAANAIAAAKPKREISPQAQAALERHRQRAALGVAILEVLEAGESGDLTTLTKLAEVHLAEAAERKAAEDAERRANAGERGAALAEYREKTKDAMDLANYLKSTGVDIQELLAKARSQ
jgi:hypothetical protein